MPAMSDAQDILHPVAIAQVMINFAADYDVDASTCLLGTGVDEARLSDPEALITRAQEMRLIENLMLALPEEPALGFKLGLRYNVATFGIWGFALRTSRTLMDAFQHALRYLPLSTAYCQIALIENDDSIGISMDPSTVPRHLRQFLLERDIATAINLLKELSLTGIQLKAMHLTGEPPSYSDELTQLGGIAPQFGRNKNALLVARADASKALPTYDPVLVRMLEDQCRQQLERRQATGLTGQVREQLLGPLGLIASLEDMAKALAMSPRSLRRKLDAENTSFRQILETERRQLAEQLLKGSKMTLDELALHLGYADTTSFTRAFRRWHAMSPGEYRKGS